MLKSSNGVSRRRRVWTFSALAVMLVLLAGGVAWADKVHLTSGDAHEDVSVKDLKRDTMLVFDEADGGGTTVAAINKIDRIELTDSARFNLAEEFLSEEDYHSALATYRKAGDEREEEWFAGLVEARIAHCKVLKTARDAELRAAGIAPDAQTTGMTYFVIPIRGGIGCEAHVETIRKGFNVARARNPDVVVLHFDSSGGSVASRDEIIELVREQKEEFRMVGYITEAGSAAAAIALMCDELVMETGSYIGGCVPFYVNSDHEARVVEKWISMEKATLRSLAEEGGHDPLLAEAMIEVDMTLRYTVADDGTIELYRDGDKGEVAKATGKISSFSPEEAVRLQLALGEVATLDNANDLLGFEVWERIPQDGEIIQDAWEKELKDAAKKYKKLVKEFRSGYDVFLTTRSGKEAIRKADELQDVLKEARAIALKYGGILDNSPFPEQQLDDPEELKELEEELEDAEKRLREKF